MQTAFSAVTSSVCFCSTAVSGSLEVRPMVTARRSFTHPQLRTWRKRLMIASASNMAAAVSSSDDQQHVKTFKQKLQLIRDRVASVAHGYHTACYLVGRPGTSKTSTVREELDRLGVASAYQNARMTPMGLFNFIVEHPEHVIVLDDIASLFKNDQAIQILLAALDGEPKKPRAVSYRSKDEIVTVMFTGAMIAISNVPLRCDPLARALGSRVVVLEHEPTDEETAPSSGSWRRKDLKTFRPTNALRSPSS